MKSLLIVNPAAGQGRPQEALEALQASLAPVLGGVVVTQERGEAERAARAAAATAMMGCLRPVGMGP